VYNVRCKLKEWEVDEEKIDGIVNELISEGYIDDERFAIIYVHGKFNIKSWGKLKIRAGLKRVHIKDEYIKKAMEEITDESYMETLNKLREKWMKRDIKGNSHIKKQKLVSYLFSRGYETDDIYKCINKHVK
jgi:regulatory protein